jgi:hypothetical protein
MHCLQSVSRVRPVPATRHLFGRLSDDRLGGVLGPAPRAALAALVDYGMTDAEIARYHRLAPDLVTQLRVVWGIGQPR